MPKEIFKIESFHGGINNNSSPRDIRDFEVVSATNCAVNSIGEIKPIGTTAAHASGTNSTTISPGYGLFTYSSDVDLAGAENTENYIEKILGESFDPSNKFGIRRIKVSTVDPENPGALNDISSLDNYGTLTPELLAAMMRNPRGDKERARLA